MAFFCSKNELKTPVCSMITYIFKRKGKGSLKKKKLLQKLSPHSKCYRKIINKSSTLWFFWHEVESRILVTILLFCLRGGEGGEQEQKVLFGRRGRILQHLMPSWSPPSAFAQCGLGSRTDQHRCHHPLLKCHKSTLRNEKRVTDTGMLSQPRCHQHSLKCPHKENKKKSTFCNGINSFFFF